MDFQKQGAEVGKQWAQQSEEMVRAWTDAQKRMWDSWFQSVQSLGSSQATDALNKAADAWQESVKRTLDMQAEWSRRWADTVSATPGAPRQVAEQARQIQEMMKNWTDMQQQIWQSWFDAVRQIDASKLSQVWNTEGQTVMRNWQEAVQRALEAQAEWTRLLTSTYASQAGQAQQAADQVQDAAQKRQR